MNTRTNSEKALKLLDGFEKVETGFYFESKMEYLIQSYHKKQNNKAGYKMAFLSLSIILVINLVTFVSLKRKGNSNNSPTIETNFFESSKGTSKKL